MKQGTKEDTINTIADKFQKECHEMVEMAIKLKPSVSYQDATNVFLFRKLAELQYKIIRLEKETFYQ